MCYQFCKKNKQTKKQIGNKGLLNTMTCLCLYVLCSAQGGSNHLCRLTTVTSSLLYSLLSRTIVDESVNTFQTADVL